MGATTLALCGAVSHAQPTKPAASTTVADAPLRAAIKVSNVDSDIMAYWLDPAHQPVPIQLTISARNGDLHSGIVDGLPRQPGNALGPLDLKLPAGIDQVVSLDPQNVLLVRGTKAGIDELRQLVARSDVPIKQTEVEVQLVELSPAELKELALPFRWTRGADEGDDKTQLAIAEFSQEAQNRLNKLSQFAINYYNARQDEEDQTRFDLPAKARDEKSKTNNKTRTAAAKALGNPVFRIINAPRVTVLDGLTSALLSTESRGLPLPVNFQTPNANDQTPPPAQDAWQAGIATVQSSTGIRVKCASKGDLIAMDLQVILNNEAEQVSAIVRDGQKLALLLPTRNSSDGATRVAIVTPKMVRR